MQKAQHASQYQPLRLLLIELRQAASLTQRAQGERLKQPQSWVHNCESGHRLVDLAEFCAWCEACGADPVDGVRRFIAGSVRKRER